MAVDIDAQAAQAAATGQQMLQDFQNKASSYKSNYDTYNAQADAANKEVGSYTDYMKGEGSAGNQYTTAFDKQKAELGYDPAQMVAARGNLNQATGAMSAYSDFANTAASKFGMNAGGFAAANAGALGGLNNNIASNQGIVNGLSDIYKTAQTGANQFTGQVIAGEHETLAGLQQVFTNATSQRDNAAEMMQFYENMAQQQGGLNAQSQQAYATAKQAYASAQQAMAQAGLLAQQIQQGKDYMGSAAYQKYLGNSPAPSTPTANGSTAKPAQGYTVNGVNYDANGDVVGHPSQPKAGYSATNPSSSWNAFTNTLDNSPSFSNTAKGAGNLINSGVSGLGWLGSKIWNG